MPKFETKRIVLCLVFFAIIFFVLTKFYLATDYSSGSFTVKDPVIDEGSTSISSLNFGLGQSIGQLAIGKSTSASFQVWSGFQYFFNVVANTLSATAGDGQVSLSWTVPQTFLGATVSGYEVGTGTSSGSYTFENVGNVTNFVKSGLTNNTPYYFIVKTLGTGGVFLVFSNEATATPIGAGGGGGGGGGGGSGSSSGAVFQGIAYPNAQVVLVRNGNVVTTSTASSDGSFTINTNGLSSGSHSFLIYAYDSENNKSANVSIFLTLASGVTTTTQNIIIPPTIILSHSEVKQGESITVRGFSAPNSQVTINFSGQQSFENLVTASSSGLYSFVLNTQSVAKGNYNVFARTKVGTFVSPQSETKSFKVGDQTVTPPPGVCKRSDLNCDGRVNLIDFSILLYFWDLSDFSKNPRVDIDSNGDVGLRDLSIMLYEWTG